MLSEEGEKLSLKTTFNPKAAGGNVEKWFIEAEAAMRETVKDVTRKSFDAHAVSKRIDWVLQWPGQVRKQFLASVLICCPVWHYVLLSQPCFIAFASFAAPAHAEPHAVIAHTFSEQ